MAQLPIPDDWNGVDTCRWAICWPDSIKWKAILYGLIESPMQGRTWDFSTGNFLELRELFRPIYDYNFTLGEVIMACGDNNIAEGLQAIATSLAQIAMAQNNANAQAAVTATITANACCEQSIVNSGGGYVGAIDNGDGTNTPIFGSQTPLSIPEGEFPEGFESLEEYQLDKCQVANLIIDGLISTIRNLGMLTGAELGASLALMIISLVAPSIIFPPAAVAVVAVAIGVGGAIFAILALVSNYINDHRDDWVCELYNGNSVEEVLIGISVLIEAMIIALTIIAPFALAVKTIILAMLNADTLNALFKLQAHATYPDADCSDCAEQQLNWDVCHEVFIEGLTFEDIEAVANCGTASPLVYGVVPKLNVLDEEGVPFVEGGPDFTVDFTVTSGSLVDPYPTTGYQMFYYSDEFGAILYQGNEEQPTLGCREFQVNSLNPFTVDITITPTE